MSAPPLRVGIGIPTRPPLALCRWMLRWARLLRLDSVWVVDHFLGFVPKTLWDGDFSFLARRIGSPDAFFEYQTLLGYLAPRAGRVRLAVGVTEPVRRHPVLLAQAFLTLSHLTKVPPILGIGAGERVNLEPYGLELGPAVRRLEEALQVLRHCLAAEGPIDFEGEFFRLEGAVMDLPPAPGRAPEVWVAAHGPRMLRLAGRYGDGWYPAYHMTPEEYAAKLQVIRAAAREAGRDPDGFTPGLTLPMVLGRTDREARRLLDSTPVRYAALVLPDELWRQHGVAHPLGPGFRGLADFVPHRHPRAVLAEAVAAVPESLLETRMAWGSPERILGYLGDLAEAGLRHVTLAALSGLVSRRALAYGFLATARLALRLRSGERETPGNAGQAGAGHPG